MKEQTQNIKVYIADDGRKFLNKDECQEHEKKYHDDEAWFKSLPQKRTDYIGNSIFNFGCEDDLVAVKVSSTEEINRLNSWLMRYDCWTWTQENGGGERHSLHFTDDCIGQTLVFTFYDDECCSYLGTKEEMIGRWVSTLNHLTEIPEETKETH